MGRGACNADLAPVEVDDDGTDLQALRTAFRLGGIAPLELPGPLVESTPMGRYFFVHVYLAALADVRRFHKQRGIPDQISWATLADLGRNLKRDRLLLGLDGACLQCTLRVAARRQFLQLVLKTFRLPNCLDATKFCDLRGFVGS